MPTKSVVTECHQLSWKTRKKYLIFKMHFEKTHDYVL